MKFWQYFIVFSICFGCQHVKNSRKKGNDFNTVIESLKIYDIARINILLDNTPESVVKDLIEAEYNYLKGGETSAHLFRITPFRFKTIEEEIFYNYSYGDYLFRQSSPIDTISFKFYLKAYSLAKVENNDELTIESLKRINQFFKKYNLGLNEYNSSIRKYKEYQNELSVLAKDSCDLFWARYYDIHLKLIQIFNEEIEIDSLNLQDFQNALDVSPEEPYFKGIIYQLQGIYYTLLKNDPVKGSESNSVAEKYYLESNIFPSKRAVFGLNINKAIADVAMQNYEIGINNFKTNLNRIPYHKSYHFYHQFTYEQLAKTYAKQKKLDSSNFYQNLATKYKDSIKSELLVLGVHEINTRFKISRFQKLLDEFKKHKLIYGTFITVILLLTLYSLLRWFKVDRINKNLKTEKDRTHEELVKVKQLVIKDTITLKNKTKILLKELIYIKAEDHYLNFYYFDEKEKKFKTELARGEIKSIITMLPPNFIRSHRSYIVNYNEVTNTMYNKLRLKKNVFIPLSRTYKNNFKNI